MLTRAQQILIKRAQAEAGLDDADYRGALGVVSGLPQCHSSTDPRLTDEHMDRLLSYFEAIYWQAVDAGEITYSYAPNRVFRVREFWAKKNSQASNSRERFNQAQIAERIMDLETQLMQIGCSFTYLVGIQNRLRGNGKSFSPIAYMAALNRTLRSKRKVGACD